MKRSLVEADELGWLMDNWTWSHYLLSWKLLVRGQAVEAGGT